MESPIVGPFDVSRSTNASDNRLVNLYPEIVETRHGKRIGALYNCPGLTFQFTLGDSPVRGMYYMAARDEVFAAAGGYLYQIDNGLAITRLGAITDATANFIDNGTQLAVFVGTQGYVWSAAAGLQTIDLPFATDTPPIIATYVDGFGLINQSGSNLWFQSDLLDLSAWNALNFASASADPDDVLAIAALHREVWLLKQFETEIWYNAGTLGFAFARLDGIYIEAGIAAIRSLAYSGETLVFLAQNRQGWAIVSQTNGHQLRRISTHAVETAIQAMRPDQIASATGFAYQQQGHEFYVLSVGDRTFVYDGIASAHAGVPMWHERGSSIPGIDSIGANSPTPPPPQPAPEIEFAAAVTFAADFGIVYGMTPDGSVMVGDDQAARSGTGSFHSLGVADFTVNTNLAHTTAMRWGRDGTATMIRRPLVSPPPPSSALAFARNSALIVGKRENDAETNDPAVWWRAADLAFTELPVLQQSDPTAVAYCCDKDGIFIYGNDLNGGGNARQTVQWDRLNATEKLLPQAQGDQHGSLVGGNTVYTCSADGTVCAGSSSSLFVPSLWVSPDPTRMFTIVPTQLLGPEGSVLLGEIYGMSSTGQILVGALGTANGFGSRRDGNGINQPYYWRIINPRQPAAFETWGHALPVVASNGTTFSGGNATAVNDDGSIICGFVYDANNLNWPCYWRLPSGRLTILPNRQSTIDFPFVGQGGMAFAISRDGMTIGGCQFQRSLPAKVPFVSWWTLSPLTETVPLHAVT